MAPFVTTGAVGGMTEGALAPNRLEINDFCANEQMFSLYIQALTAMSKDSQDNRESLFQIGSIHGLPYKAWDGVGGDDPVEKNGYCTHGSVLFPTWHRPYVAIYEQIIQAHAKEIAKTYKDNKDRWVKAAADLRQPFWDWAKNIVPPAEVISLTHVTITTPDGKRTKVENPLYQYKFNPVDPSFKEKGYDKWPTTLRHPTTQGPDAESDIEGLVSELRINQSDIRTKVFYLLSQVRTWLAFSNHTPIGTIDASNSLEAIHDSIHILVGRSEEDKTSDDTKKDLGGHMSDIAVAGFDPIFYLHHCNVDRLISLWSALNHGVWVSPGVTPAQEGTWTIKDGAKVDKTTPLTPFRRSQSDFWSSAETGTAVPHELGYSYPEFNGLDMGNPRAVRTHIARIVNRLYGSKRSFAESKREGPVPTPAVPTPSVPVPAPAPGAREDQTEAQITIAGAPSDGVGNGLWDWTVRIQVKKYELGGSFSVLLFLGGVPETLHGWRQSPHYVGAHHAFVSSTPQHCTNCVNQSDIVIEGFVHINEAIAAHSGLNSFNPDVIRPYLQEHLHWRVLNAGGSEHPLESLTSLEVTVTATWLIDQVGADFPVAGNPVFHHDVTHGRVGGARHHH